MRRTIALFGADTLVSMATAAGLRVTLEVGDSGWFSRVRCVERLIARVV